MEKVKKTNRLLLILGLLFNIGLLGYFKYVDFFISNINSVFTADLPLKNILLPLGISFFTLQQISFIIDRYRGDAPHYSFLKYAAYVTYFPQLVAGPIVLHSQLIPQFDSDETKKFHKENLIEGFVRFSLGLAKKVLIADFFAYPVNFGFEKLHYLDTPSAWLVGICYTLEIYFDFSGYSDMACGLGKMFGINLPENFNSPYKATDVREFWKRWHMTLSNFLTSYIYIPLGGNRKGTFHTIINTMLVFAISGFWHGASWSFILWGVLHGLGVVISRQSKKFRIPKAISWILTMIFLVVTWTIFRSENLGTATLILKQMFVPNYSGFILDLGTTLTLIPEFKAVFEYILRPGYPTVYIIYILIICLFAVICYFISCQKNSKEITLHQKSKNYDLRFIIALSLVFTICVVQLTGVSTFLYFNF